MKSYIRPALLAVVALPILGGWSYARAGYIALGSAIVGPPGALSLNPPDDADTDDRDCAGTYAGPTCEIGPLPDGESRRQSGVHGLPCTGRNAGDKWAATTYGESSDDPGGDGYDKWPGAASCVTPVPPDQAAILLRQASVFRPPPFPSRIFRPPRGT